MNKLREFTAECGFDDIEFLQNNSFMYEDIAICGTRGWINPGWDNFGGEDRKLSLNSVKECNEIYVFTHYPPMPISLKENEFVQMMKKYPVTKCIYGHLHAAAHRNAVEGTINGIEFYRKTAIKFQFYRRNYMIRRNEYEVNVCVRYTRFVLLCPKNS